MSVLRWWIAVAALLLGGFGCSERAEPRGEAAPDLVVRTTFYPTTYLAQRIGGGLIEIECPLPEGEDPATWSPSPEEIGLYQRARLVVVNGAGLERWAASAALPRSRVVDTSAGLTEQLIELETASHSHGPRGAHSHGGVDGHTWMDPALAIEQGRAILDGLSRAFPEHADAFGANFDGLAEDLGLLDAQLGAIDSSGVSMIARRPAYRYLARRYGWTIQNLDLDPETELAESDIVMIVSMIAPGDRGVVLWESAPLAGTVAMLEAVGLRSVVYSPAENPGPVAGEGDYLTIMRGNIERLSAALGGG